MLSCTAVPEMGIRRSGDAAPGATLCGGVSVGALTTIGAGATVTPNVRIGANAFLGAGGVAVEDMADDEQLKPWRRGRRPLSKPT